MQYTNLDPSENRDMTHLNTLDHPFHGLWVALATPFGADGEVDLEAFQRLVRHCVEGRDAGPRATDGAHAPGVDGLLVLGSTGEAATLVDDERDRLIAMCLEAAGSIPVMVGTGANATPQAVRLTRRAEELGAQGALVVTPWYNKPNAAGLQAHYAAIADAVDMPLVVYNVPGRTGLNVTPEALAQLWHIPSVVAIKESSGNIEQIDAMVRTAPAGKAILAGDDGLALAAIAVGARGLVSVVANVLPAATQALVADALESRFPAARHRHARLLPVVEALFCESNPVPLKAALHHLGLAENHVRAPLAIASDATRRQVVTVLRALSAAEAA